MNMMHIENKNVRVANGRFIIDEPYTAEIPVSSLVSRLEAAVSAYNPADTGVSCLAVVRTDIVPFDIEAGYKISPLFETSKYVLSRMDSYDYPIDANLPREISKEQITQEEAEREDTLIVFIVNMDTGETMVTLSLDRDGYKVNSTSLDIDEGEVRELLRTLRRIVCSDITEFYKS